MIIVKEQKIPTKDAQGNIAKDPLGDRTLYNTVLQDESIEADDVKKIRPYTEPGKPNSETIFCMVSFYSGGDAKVKSNWKDFTEEVNKHRTNKIIEQWGQVPEK